MDNDYIRQRQRQWDGELFGFSQHRYEYQISDDYSSRKEPRGYPDTSTSTCLYLLNFTDEPIIDGRWWYGQHQRERIGQPLQLERLRECKLDNDHIRQRQRQWNGELFGFSEHRHK